MIPQELYRPADEDELVEENTRYYKHKKQPLALEVKKEITKRKKAEKYSMSTGDSDEESSAEAESGEDDDNSGDDSADDEDEDEENKGQKNAKKAKKANGDGNGEGSDNHGSVPQDDNSMQTLRERLQSRIDTMKEARTSKKRPFEQSGNSKKEKQQKAQKKNDSANKVKGSGEQIKDTSSSQLKQENDNKSLDNNSNSTSQSNNDLVENLAGDVDIDYSTFSGNGDSKKGKGLENNKGKPGTKKQRLERMLEDADKRRQRLEQLRRGGDEGKQRLKEEQWNDVINQVSGTNVIDTTKVRKALKRREKDKQKSAQAWNARTKAVEDFEKDKIKSREGNLKTRKQQITGTVPVLTEEELKKDSRPGGRNKEKAIQRNQQKRPGFEGKTGGGQFLNSKQKKTNAKQDAKSAAKKSE